MSQTPPEPAAEPSGDIVARVDFQYRWRSWAVAILLLGMGVYCLHDGFFVYPRENAAWEKMGDRVDRPARPPHDPAGVLFNQFAGVVCTIVGIPFLVLREYRSLGEYRLADRTLHVPGHPPIPFEHIQGLDLTRWDRKGIAILECKDAGKNCQVLLNDMIYDRGPTDRIVKQIEAHLASMDMAESGSPQASNPAP
jgi:hypothetical protein